MINKDNIYQHKHSPLQDFRFDTKVVPVFEDMILRSVPGYQHSLELIQLLINHYAQDNTALYDLGCSLGRITQLFLEKSPKHEGPLIAVDLSPDMLKQCQSNLEPLSKDKNLHFICEDITSLPLQKTSVVVLNYTLQFVPPKERNALLLKIYHALTPGGILIISEKIHSSIPQQEQFLTETHTAFKRAQGYSDLEISQKRTALEKVLIPDTFEKLNQRLLTSGFSQVEMFSKALNFVSLVAFK